jgi:hypothetical protein
LAKQPIPIELSENELRKSKPPSTPPGAKIPRVLKVDKGRDSLSHVLARYGLTVDSIKGLMLVGKRLAQVAGGVKGVIEALRGDDAPDSLLFVEKWDSITPHDQKRIPIEAVCVIAEISPRRLIELVSGALATQSDEDTRLIVSSFKAKVVAKTAKLALTTLGEKDREMFHKHTEFIPRPSAPSVTIDQRTQNNTLMNGGEERALPPPKADDFLLELSATIRPAAPALVAPEPTVIAHIPDVEYVDADV